MKYPSKTYAKALIDFILEKNSKKYVAAFLDFLIKNGDVKKTGQIIFLAEKLYYKKTDKRNIVLEAARKVNQKDFLKDFFQEGDRIKEKINPDLIAGIKVVINGEKQLDFSLKNKLEKIFS